MQSDYEKREKFERIYGEYKNDIYGVAMHYAKDYDMAQEITQTAFYKLYLGIENVREETVRALLIRIVKNTYLNRIRDTRVEASGELLDVLDECDVSTIAMEDAYMEKEDKNCKRDLCHSILERLGKEHPTWCEALIEVYYRERPQALVAEELGISLEVLHSRLYRARQWIRKNYQTKYDDITGWK